MREKRPKAGEQIITPNGEQTITHVDEGMALYVAGDGVECAVGLEVLVWHEECDAWVWED